MWIVEIELRTLNNKILKRVGVKNWKSFTEQAQHIDDDITGDTERWVVIYDGNYYTAEFKIE